ncbi:unnamed protein product [Linum trigynum]|uniref:BHLH domain-containing protein n=1 Tax=Linum trigynum TaxID=586398 RepID=A0AAV2CYG1_9ROSI
MNHFVPVFEMEDDDGIPSSSAFNGLKKSSASEDDIMELLWQNGQVVVQSQTQRSLKRSPKHDGGGGLNPADHSAFKEIRPSFHDHPALPAPHLFMQEDEMASWLHYPIHEPNFDQDLCADLLYPAAPCITAALTAATGTASATTNVGGPPVRPLQNQHLAVARPPIPPPRKPDVVQNFAHFSRHRAAAVRGNMAESGPSNSKTVVRESTVVDSSDTPALRLNSRVSEAFVAASISDNLGGTLSVSAAGVSGGAGHGAMAAGPSTSTKTTKDVMTCEMTVTSSPGGSSSSAVPATQSQRTEDRKRKGREEEGEYHSEDAEFESVEVKKQARGSTSSNKRSRAAEVHNLSERRRRDRINEKMRALQELIPRCNKSDKASMLDEAIEYLKSLQLQVQMMSMGCSMVPMMFPGVQQYMPPMGMGMGMGMGMEMGMNRPMMPFPNVLAGGSLQSAAAHLGQRFPVPAFQMPPVLHPDASRIQVANQSDPMLSTLGASTLGQQRPPNFPDPYQQFLGLHQMQMPIPMPQNQLIPQPSTSKPSSSPGGEHGDGHQSGTFFHLVSLQFTVIVWITTT